MREIINRLGRMNKNLYSYSAKHRNGTDILPAYSTSICSNAVQWALYAFQLELEYFFVQAHTHTHTHTQ